MEKQETNSYQDDGMSSLTTSQFRIWTGQKLDPQTPLYNMALAFSIQGPVDEKCFKDAFQALISRSDILRTVFDEHDDIPQARVRADVPCHLDVIDFSGDPEGEKRVLSWMKDRARKNFNLAELLFDSVLIRLSSETHVWYLNQHHLITDGWSCAEIYQKMQEYYRLAQEGGLSDAPPLFAYGEYQRYESSFLHSKNYQTAVEYWQQKSSVPIPPLKLYGRAPSVQSTRSDRYFHDLGVEVSESLRALALEKDFRSFNINLSLFNIFAALVFAYMSRVSSADRFALGAPAHNRPTSTFKKTLGLFIELFPLAVDVSSEETFRSLIKKVSGESFDFLRHAQPGTSREIPGSGYGVVLNFINATFSDFCDMDTSISWIHPGHGDRGHALRLQVHDFEGGGSYQLHFDFSCEVFSPLSARRAIGHFIRLVEALIKDPDTPITTVQLLSPEELEILVSGYNQTTTPLPAGVTVVDLFQQQVASTPATVALEDGTTKLTYGELDEKSDVIARYLQAQGVGREGPVAVLLERSAELVIAILGVLKAGAAYVPIDSAFPDNRIAIIIEDCNASIVLTQEDFEKRLPSMKGAVVCCDVILQGNGLGSGPAPENNVKPHDLAYMIYTSGSTGKPKGVMIEHGSLANYLLWARKTYMHDGPHDLPFFTTIAADLTITSIYLPLISGSKVIVYREIKEGGDLSILDVFNEDRVDVIKLTPSHLSLLEERPGGTSRLKKLIVGGEDFKAGLAHRVAGFFSGNIEIYNEYGPTEATVGCMIYRFDPVRDGAGSVAIGTPIDNLAVYLLDEALNPVPVGVRGDMYIGGSGLARGYLNQREMTEERFIVDPFQPGKKMYLSGDEGRWRTDGVMDYLGRKDSQVKVRGFRVEQGEIEAALLQFPDISETLVQIVEQQSQPASDDIAYCTSCGLASNHPQADLNDEGICAVCQNFEPLQQQGSQYFRTEADLQQILAQAKESSRGPYDSLMLFSGGKDSTFALYKLVEMGMHPLVFSFDNGYIPESVKENIRNVVADLGLDLEWGHTEAMDEIFADSLQRFSNVCNGCQKALNTLSVNIALQKGIGCIVTGLSRGQSFETRVSEMFKNNIFDSEEIDRTVIQARLAYHRMEDAVSKHLDVSAFADDTVFDKVQFVDFYRYCDVELDEILNFLKEKTPWRRPPDTGRSTNCLINEVGIYIHKKERGYHNYALPYSWDVRLGHKNRDSALAELDDDIDEARVERVLHKIGYDPDQKSYSSTDRRIVAYYVADRDISQEELRSFLTEVLPLYMVPAHFIRMDAFPLNPTGKVDHTSLPPPDTSNLGGGDYAPARNPTEEQLCSIWAKVLGLERVGIHDNFFDLGGDSILNIQIVSHAGKAGLEITPGMLFRHQTVAELAAVTTPASGSKAQGGEGVRFIPMTPIQQWFFNLRLPRPHIWNMALKLNVLQKLEPAVVEQSLKVLVSHHDALRLRFKNESGDWQQCVAETENATLLQTEHIEAKSELERQRQIDDSMQARGSKLDLGAGPLLQAVYFTCGDDATDMLGIVIHHLAVDAVSWYILLEDLQTVYRQLERGEAADLPIKTTTFPQWAEKLHAYANSSAAEEEHPYWKDISLLPWVPLPRDMGLPGNGVESSAGLVVVELNEGRTGELISKVTADGQITVEELLLAALVQTMAKWANASSIRIAKEGHGREGIIEGAAIYQTVGWFTSIFPLDIAIVPGGTLDQLLSAVRQSIRSLPNRGIGYGLLRYSHSEEGLRQELARGEQSDVLFNYLGSLNQMTDHSSLFGVAGHLPASRDTAGNRPYLVEINSFVVDGRLRVSWGFSRERHRRETIETLAGEMKSSLVRLIDHCLDEPQGLATPVDVVRGGTGLPTQAVDGNWYPLSPLQSGILYHSLKEPGSGVYVVQYSCRLHGPLQVDTFKRAWQWVVQRHPALRTHFSWNDEGEAFQVVSSEVDFEWSEEDASALTVPQLGEKLDKLLEQDRTRGYALDTSPPMRFFLFAVNRQEHHLVWSFHHILCDGWSSAIVLQEVFFAYSEFSKGRQPEAASCRPYGEFIQWLGRQNLSSAEQFWKRELAGVSTLTPLPYRQHRRDDHGSGRHQLLFSQQSTSELVTTAQRQRLTLSTIVQGAWAVLLHRCSGEEDVVFGTTVSGRPPSMEGIEKMVGLFINTLPVRTTIEGSLSFSSWLSRFMAKQVEMREFDYSPLVEVQQWSDFPPGSPLFESIVVFENQSLVSAVQDLSGEIHASQVSYADQSSFPFALLVIPEECLRLIAVYDRSLFGREDVARLLEQLQMVVMAFIHDPNQKMGDLAILTESDKEQLARWQVSRQRALPWRKSVLDLFHEQVHRNSQREAVVYQKRRLDYKALNSWANSLAHDLLLRGVGPGKKVGVCIDRSPEMITALLAVLKTGAAYVPLDPTYPPERLAYMVDDTHIELVLTQQSLVADVPLPRENLVVVDATGQEKSGTGDENPDVDIEAGSLAYIIYTSGSTGAPKGVMVTHTNLSHATTARIDYYQRAPERFLLLSGISFDSSVAGIFGTLCRGGCLHIPDRGRHLDVIYLARLIAAEGVTDLLAIPSLYREILHGGGASLRSLEVVIVAGESCPHDLMKDHFRRLPDTELYNEYGPTEATVWSTVFRCRPDSCHHSVPIGQPIDDVLVYILDKQLRQVPPGVQGELFLGGPGITRGYLNKPEMTAKFFLDSPFEETGKIYKTGDLVRYFDDGHLEFLGRNDGQVMMRGYRIEPGEIEAAIGSLEQVQQAIVVPVLSSPLSDGRAEGSGDSVSQLRAFVVPGDGRSVDREEVVHHLSTMLPRYMIPDDIVTIDSIPRSPNGKIDRNRLLQIEQREKPLPGAQGIPADAVEEKLLHIWQNLLARDEIGPTENFFHLGGHSLLAMRLLVAVEKEFGESIQLTTFIQKPTIRELRHLVGEKTENNGKPLVIPLRAQGSRPPLFWAHGWAFESSLHSYFHPDQPCYFIYPFGVGVVEDISSFTSLERLAAYHIEEIRKIQPVGPYRLGGYSMGGLLAYEIAHQLRQRGERIALLFLLDPNTPGMASDKGGNAVVKEDKSGEQKEFPSTSLAFLKKVKRMSWDVLKRKRAQMWARVKVLTAETYLSFGKPIPPSLHKPYNNEMYKRAVKKYQPKGYEGELILIQVPGKSGDKSEVWGKLATGQLTVHNLTDIVHTDLFEKPHIDEWASLLGDYLDKTHDSINRGVSRN